MKTTKTKIKILVSFLLVFCFLFTFLSVSASAAERDYRDLELIAGGIPFGVKFSIEGVVVTGFSDVSTADGVKNPASLAGLKQKDIILKVNGESVSSVAGLNRVIEGSGGKKIKLTYSRAGESGEINVTPVKSSDDGKYKIGLTVKDGGAGIGTVTYIVPDSLMFGGLGHGLCDSESGNLVKMNRGIVNNVKINGIKKGVSGTPGEIKGVLGFEKKGILFENTTCGVFGVYSSLPENATEKYKVGLRDEVRNGEAYIITTLDADGTPQKYKIEISNIDRSADGAKCFCVKVTDKRLIEKTGGIVQGMSGSPIIQNGKIIGAVTHVFINDPTVGYGIFIENMLNAAQVTISKVS